MTTSPSKTLSPAELAKLEHAFATDPTSDAYQPLAEAYLGMGRFMEAMVVCKKGVKAHPNVAIPRVLLARVYAEQGKDKKALEEALGALQVAPTDTAALRCAGNLQLKTGEAEPGKANLLKALELDPGDAETQALLAQWKIEAPKPKPPEPPTERINLAQAQAMAAAGAPAQPSPAAPIAGPGARQIETVAPIRARLPTGAAAPAAAHAHGNAAPARTMSSPAMRAAPAAAPRPAPRPQPRFIDDDDEDELETSRPNRRAAAKSNRSKTLFIAMAAILPISIGGYFFYGSYKAKQTREIGRQLKEATDELKHDSYGSYQKSIAAAEKALDLDPGSTAAHAYLAYAYTIQYGELGSDVREQAQQHLQAASSAGSDTAFGYYFHAAQALQKHYDKKTGEAIAELEKRIAEYEAKKKTSPTLLLTLGILQMNAGDFDRARENLLAAQEKASDDPRIWAALGNLYRRQGENALAAVSYDSALRYEKGHPDSLLGASQLLLEQETPNYAQAARFLNLLLKGETPPSPRQGATAQMIRALLISKANRPGVELKPEVKKELEAMGIPTSAQAAASEISRSELAAINADKNNPELKLIRGQRFISEGKIDEAVAAIREAIQMDPTRALYYAELARALMLKDGGERQAVNELNAAIRQVGESPKLMYLLGNAYRKQGRTNDALEQYTRALRDPKTKNPEARMALGELYREKQDYTKAQAELEQAIKELTGSATKLAMTYTVLGRVFEEKGDRNRADETFQRALNTDGDYLPAYYFYAKFLAGSGREPDKAKATAREYLRRAPTGEYAEQARAILES